MVNSLRFLSDGDINTFPIRSERNYPPLCKTDSKESEHELASDYEDQEKEGDEEEPGDKSPYRSPRREGSPTNSEVRIGSDALYSRKRAQQRTDSVKNYIPPKQRISEQDVITTLLGTSRIDSSNLVKLGHTGWAVARDVFHPPYQ